MCTQEVRPVVPVTTSSPRLSLRARCVRHCPVTVSHCPAVPEEAVSGTVTGGVPHSATPGRRVAAVREPHCCSRIVTVSLLLRLLSQAGSLCVSSAFGNAGVVFTSLPCSSEELWELFADRAPQVRVDSGRSPRSRRTVARRARNATAGRLQPHTLPATTVSTEPYRSITVVLIPERAFNLDTCRNCLSLSKGELCIDAGKV